MSDAFFAVPIRAVRTGKGLFHGISPLVGLLLTGLCPQVEVVERDDQEPAALADVVHAAGADAQQRAQHGQLEERRQDREAQQGGQQDVDDRQDDVDDDVDHQEHPEVHHLRAPLEVEVLTLNGVDEHVECGL